MGAEGLELTILLKQWNLLDIECLTLIENVSFPLSLSGTLEKAAILSTLPPVLDSPKAMSKNKEPDFSVYNVATRKLLPIFLALTPGQSIFHWPLFM